MMLKNQYDSHFQIHKLEEEEGIKSHSNYLNKVWKISICWFKLAHIIYIPAENPLAFVIKQTHALDFQFLESINSD